jgi:CMP-N,N'-diacetyllegionaminic acid synthase
MESPSFLTLIPARGGSKGVPRKNILPLCGKPLIAWSIEAARACPALKTICVSTDDREIANTSREWGADVPFMRPADLSTDTAGSFEVGRHALEFYDRELGRKFDFLLLLQPTSPLRRSEDIEAAIEILLSKGADNVVSVCEMEYPPEWANALPPDGSLEGFLREDIKDLRRQDLPVSYRINGAIYICRIGRFVGEGTFIFKDRCFASVMPAERSVDIDNLLDFRIAEALLCPSSP